MFSRQAPLIAESLWQGGLSSAQSNTLANALGQCRAPIVHRAPITVDYTTPKMRLITRESAKFEFPDVALQPPEVLPPEPPVPEEEPTPEENPLPPPEDPVGPIQPPYGSPGGPSAPGYTPVPYAPPWLNQWMRQATNAFNKLKQDFEDYKASHPDYTDGDYIEVDNDVSRTISLRTSGDSEDNICTFGFDEIVGQPLTDLVDQNIEGIIELLREELAGDADSTVSVLTGVRLTESGLEFDQTTLNVIRAGEAGEGPVIGVAKCPQP